MSTTNGVLRVGAAFPDPPFEVSSHPPSGLDHDLTRAIARELRLTWELRRYTGADFDGIFAGLGARYDIVASGATITDHRQDLARWCEPYLRSGQSLTVDADRTPAVRSTDDLTGLVLGVQNGNTSEPVARGLQADGKVHDVKVYAYDEILVALDDLESGTIGAFMKLEPVMRWLTAMRPSLQVVETGITTERIAVAVALADERLAAAIDRALATMRRQGTLAEIGARWLHGSDPAATEMAT